MMRQHQVISADSVGVWFRNRLEPAAADNSAVRVHQCFSVYPQFVHSQGVTRQASNRGGPHQLVWPEPFAAQEPEKASVGRVNGNCAVDARWRDSELASGKSGNRTPVQQIDTVRLATKHRDPLKTDVT